MKKKGLLRGLKAMGRSETLVEAPAVYLPPLVLRVLRQMGFISALDLWCVAHACRRHLALLADCKWYWAGILPGQYAENLVARAQGDRHVLQRDFSTLTYPLDLARRCAVAQKVLPEAEAWVDDVLFVRLAILAHYVHLAEEIRLTGSSEIRGSCSWFPQGGRNHVYSDEDQGTRYYVSESVFSVYEMTVSSHLRVNLGTAIPDWAWFCDRTLDMLVMDRTFWHQLMHGGKKSRFKKRYYHMLGAMLYLYDPVASPKLDNVILAYANATDDPDAAPILVSEQSPIALVEKRSGVEECFKMLEKRDAFSSRDMLWAIGRISVLSPKLHAKLFAQDSKLLMSCAVQTGLDGTKTVVRHLTESRSEPLVVEPQTIRFCRDRETLDFLRNNAPKVALDLHQVNDKGENFLHLTAESSSSTWSRLREDLVSEYKLDFNLVNSAGETPVYLWLRHYAWAVRTKNEESFGYTRMSTLVNMCIAQGPVDWTGVWQRACRELLPVAPSLTGSIVKLVAFNGGALSKQDILASVRLMLRYSNAARQAAYWLYTSTCPVEEPLRLTDPAFVKVIESCMASNVKISHMVDWIGVSFSCAFDSEGIPKVEEDFKKNIANYLQQLNPKMWARGKRGKR